MLKILPDDHIQALRVRRFLLAQASYLLLLAVLIVLHFSGFSRGITFELILAFFTCHVLINLGIFILLRTGANRKFKDPSLTMVQILLGTVYCTVLSYYSADAMRGVILIGYILTFMFGTFRLTLKEFFMLVAIAVLLYTGAVTLLYHNVPEAVVVRMEVVRVLVLLLALSWVSVMASYIVGLRGKIKYMATHDALTGAYNRWQAMKILNREKAFSDRSGIPFSICMIDLDDFKQVNDNYGHLAGDRVLTAVAAEFQANTRTADYVSRFGGEEFIVIFVNFQCRDAGEKNIQRLLERTERLRFPDISPSLKITASLGVTVYEPPESIDALFARADKALYEAKASGKNTAVLLGVGPSQYPDNKI